LFRHLVEQYFADWRRHGEMGRAHSRQIIIVSGFALGR
jgi:hypothetical protein